jgi:beta-glucosidase
MKGDRASLDLPEGDVALVGKARASGAPVTTILLSGRPLILGSALDESDAFIAAWLPGTEGQGVADVLFGDVRPTGKLPREWPRDNHQLDVKKMSGEPLFPCGFGLAY